LWFPFSSLQIEINSKSFPLYFGSLRRLSAGRAPARAQCSAVWWHYGRPARPGRGLDGIRATTSEWPPDKGNTKVGLAQVLADSICTAHRQLRKDLDVPNAQRYESRNGLNTNTCSNVEHSEHMMVRADNHLGGRSEDLNTADSSSDSLYAVRVPGGIGVNLVEFLWGTCSQHQGTQHDVVYASK
jgi:hypothetical protein